MDTWRVHDYGYLLALDGTQHFSSSHIHCEQCLTKTHHNGTVTYSHQVLTPVLTAPDKPQVIPLPPEFISRQDGQTKQDCEINAAKRWLAQWGADYIPLGITFLGMICIVTSPFAKPSWTLAHSSFSTANPLPTRPAILILPPTAQSHPHDAAALSRRA
ncbi:hypothetical protein [Thiothrix subterranea]|uniref:Uncharacterized protein n=1 Tax=Thiothrix subterranea TaxID=2735563 RepID=A0AA51MKG6_9GAMM|nr:hypothetical protein [Thiothrix subterranea]WML85930.1 hypothetical protein RCG00_16700 [Thiothrix subterranea]